MSLSFEHVELCITGENSVQHRLQGGLPDGLQVALPLEDELNELCSIGFLAEERALRPTSSHGEVLLALLGFAAFPPKVFALLEACLLDMEPSTCIA